MSEARRARGVRRRSRRLRVVKEDEPKGRRNRGIKAGMSSRSPWRKSSISGADNCVEVAFDEGVVMVRDSKDPDGAVVRFRLAEWEAFLVGVRRGEFDA